MFLTEQKPNRKGRVPYLSFSLAASLQCLLLRDSIRKPGGKRDVWLAESQPHTIEQRKAQRDVFEAERQWANDRQVLSPYIRDKIIRNLWRVAKVGETTWFDLLLFQMRKLRPKGKKCLVKKGHSTFKYQSQDRNLNSLVFHFTEIPAFQCGL